MILNNFSKIRIILGDTLLLMVLIGLVITVGLLKGDNLASADENPGTNISPVDASPYYDDTGPPEATSTFWAWNEVIGWIDFHNTHTVNVRNKYLGGYSDSPFDEISLNCETSPVGNICGVSDYKVESDGGNLFGWAWNDLIGWISFCNGQGTSTCPTTSFPFQTRIENAIVPDQPPSDFVDYAWNDVVGWISFNCEGTGHSGDCATGLGPDYRVRTKWFATSTVGYLDSATFDTLIPGSVKYNSILWDGAMPAGTGVSFQLATSDSPDGPGGDWSKEDFWGPSGTDADSYDFNSGHTKASQDKEYGRYFFTSLGDPNYHFGKRYFRYRVWLFSNSNSPLSPRVDEVIINWGI